MTYDPYLPHSTLIRYKSTHKGCYCASLIIVRNQGLPVALPSEEKSNCLESHSLDSLVAAVVPENGERERERKLGIIRSCDSSFPVPRTYLGSIDRQVRGRKPEPLHQIRLRRRRKGGKAETHRDQISAKKWAPRASPAQGPAKATCHAPVAATNVSLALFLPPPEKEKGVSWEERTDGRRWATSKLHKLSEI